MSSRRERPYISKPSEDVKQRLSAAASARLMVVQEAGPTCFVLKAPANEKKYRVFLGGVHTCSCGAGAAAQPCEHTAFVLLRVFRLSVDDSRVWQQSMIDSELEKLIEDRARAVARLRMQARRDAREGSVDGEDREAKGKEFLVALNGQVARRQIDEDEGEPCPICYEDILMIEEQEELLDWCRQGCGKSVHRSCLKVWADHQASISKTLSCPFCRCNWGEPAPPVSRARHAGGGPSMVSGSRGEKGGGNVGRSRAPGRRPTRWVDGRCRSCRTCPIYGTLYRCLVCPDRPGERVELCSDCFGSGMHSHHPFGCKARASQPWIATQERAPAPRQLLPLGHGMPHGGVPPHEVDRGAVGSPAVIQALQQLQHREIGPEDYELLLALHETTATPAPVLGSTSREARRGGQVDRSGARIALPPPPLSDDGAVQLLLAALNERETLERDARAVEQQDAGPCLRLGRPLVAFGSSSGARAGRRSADTDGDGAREFMSLDFGLTGLSLGFSDVGLAVGAGPGASSRLAADGPGAVGHAGVHAHRHRPSAVSNRSTTNSTLGSGFASCRSQRQPPNFGIGAHSLECTATSISSQGSGRVLPVRSVSAGNRSRRIGCMPGLAAPGAIPRVDVAPSIQGLVGLSHACNGFRPSV